MINLIILSILTYIIIILVTLIATSIIALFKYKQYNKQYDKIIALDKTQDLIELPVFVSVVSPFILPVLILLIVPAITNKITTFIISYVFIKLNHVNKTYPDINSNDNTVPKSE